MSEEEKKAMWYLEEVLVDTTTDIEQWKVIENLIEKQQKEIETEKEKNKELNIENNWLHTEYDKMFDDINELDKNSISKDKIREKIEDLEATINEYYNSGIGIPISDEFQYKIDILQELLEGE